MSLVLQKNRLTAEQEGYVWQWICWHMNDDDKNPIDVIKDDYHGDKSLYLETMVDWHRIQFCNTCRKPKHGEIDLCKCSAW